MNSFQFLSDKEENSVVSNPLKKRNKLKIRIIKHLHQEGCKSIPELCSIARVSSPTLKRLLVELESEGLILEKGLGESGGGRKPSIYGLNPDSRFILGIDITRFELRIGMYNLSCEASGKMNVLPEGLETGIDVIKVLKEQVNLLLKKSGVTRDRILGAGIALPGLIDMKTGISHSYLVQEGIPLADYLAKELSLPVYLEHDSRSMARGEQMFGLARGKQNVLCLNLGSGIGLSMILNGSLYSGESGYAGEFGHINVDPSGELCYCGKIGCLETVASGRTLRRKVTEDLKNGTKSMIRQLIGNDLSLINLHIILQAAESGDQYAIELIAGTGLHLGKGIATLIHLFNPELIIIGGTLSKAGHILLDPIQQALNSNCIPRIRQESSIVISELGGDASLLGTLALVMDKVFEARH